MLFSLSPDSKLHTRVNEKRDRERHGVVWGETIFCTPSRMPPSYYIELDINGSYHRGFFSHVDSIILFQISLQSDA